MRFSGGILIFSDEIMNFIKVFMTIFIAISILYVFNISLFLTEVFKYFKRPKYEGYIPFYNAYMVLKLLKLPVYHTLMLFIPFLNIAFIFKLNSKLCQYFDKNPDYIWGMMVLPFLYMSNLVEDKGKFEREEALKKQTTKAPKYSLKSLDVNLLTDKELENLNKAKMEESGVDSIFKADIDMIEDAKPYRAGKQKMDVVEDEVKYERETIKKVESVKARDIARDGKFIKEEDVIEKIDL